MFMRVETTVQHILNKSLPPYTPIWRMEKATPLVSRALRGDLDSTTLRSIWSNVTHTGRKHLYLDPRFELIAAR